MHLPEPLAAALAAADENYLIGLCNKGTVNRAKKDLAALDSPEVQETEDGVEVRVGDALCLIKAPLGESRCSCPSSGICRHRITTMLWLQGQLAAPAEEAPAEAEPPQNPDFAQLRDYPTEKLAKQLGAKRLYAILFRHRSGTGPVLEETSVVTAEMPWLPATVRLLEPLEHSTCTCHSKTFCLHKAEALLYWQLAQGLADPAALEATAPPEEALDLERLRGVCRAVQETLTAHMVTGLSRLSPSVQETTERMAALCHTARLPELERALRSLHGEYVAYFARSAAYRDDALLARLSRAFRLAQALETADEKTAARLAGVFREDYLPVGRLELYLLGLRAFSGRSGYAGTIYYFWEGSARRFYTFSDLRPTFYEGAARRRGDTAPWGLPCTLRQAKGCALELTGAKATRSGGLSSTEQCSGVLLGHREPGRAFPWEEVYTDFSRLLAERSAPHAPEPERLAVLQPSRCEAQEYDQVRQVFSLRLLDGAGRDIWLEVSYKQEAAKLMERMEALVQQLQSRPFLRPVFFGILYREGDRLKLSPIEAFTHWEETP